MFEIWSRIDYAVQLLTAASIMTVSIYKRPRYALRAVLTGLAICLGYYLLNGVIHIHSFPFGAVTLVYWLSYIIFCGVFIGITCNATLAETVFLTTCTCAMQHITYDLCTPIPIETTAGKALNLCVYVLVYFLFYRYFARSLMDNGEFHFSGISILPTVSIVLIVWLFSLLDESGLPLFAASTGHRVMFRIIDAMCCFYVIWGQVKENRNYQLRHSMEVSKYLLEQQKKQYELTGETISNINRKCHDMKYQLRHLGSTDDEDEKRRILADLEDDIMIYDTHMKTGNQALDIVLMEKGLICKNNGIRWNCMADGFQLNFMKNEDIYSIFGNAFDNAITAVMKLQDPDKRAINTTMHRKNSIAYFTIRNYYEGTITMADGLPKTTKTDHSLHGFGLQSIQYNVEKYNGTIDVNADNGIFTLTLMIPLPLSGEAQSAS